MFVVFYYPELIRYHSMGKEDGMGTVSHKAFFHFTLSDGWSIFANLVLDSERAFTRLRLPPSELASLVIFLSGSIYLRISIRSNDYSHNDCKSNLKAILLNKVVVGKGCKMLQDNTSLTSPPTGFDSVRLSFPITMIDF